MKVTDKKLFMRYAIPCADTLVERGNITQGRLDDLIRKMVSGLEFTGDDISIFKVAKAHCTMIAKRNGKKEIDAEVIEEYFLGKHDKVVDERYEQMRDFDPERCRIYTGKVLLVKDGKATVETPKGRSEFRADFLPDVMKGDSVIVHRDFIVKRKQ
jgi:hypothetical protein